MHSALSVLTRYRWELAPFVALGLAGWLLGPLAAALRGQPNTTGVMSATLSLAVALALALAIPRVRRQGRPLLTTLWMLSKLTTAVSAASKLVVGTALALDLIETPQRLGLLLLPGAIGTVAAVVWLGARVARYGMRFAMLVAAAYVVPAWVSNLVEALTASVQHGQSLWVTGSVLALPLGLTAIAVIVYACHHGMAMAPDRLGRWVVLLLVLGVAATAVQQAPSAVRLAAEGELPEVLSVLALPALGRAVYIAVMVGLVWLFSRGRVQTVTA